MLIKVNNEKTAKDGIIAIGKELIKKAEDITKDLKYVSSITIYAQLNPNEVVNFDITKNYTAILEEETKED